MNLYRNVTFERERTQWRTFRVISDPQIDHAHVHIRKVPFWAHCNTMNWPGCLAGFSIMLRALDLCIVNVHWCRNSNGFLDIFILGYDTNLRIPWNPQIVFFDYFLVFYISVLCRMQRMNGDRSGGYWIVYVCWFSLQLLSLEVLQFCLNNREGICVYLQCIKEMICSI